MRGSGSTFAVIGLALASAVGCSGKSAAAGDGAAPPDVHASDAADAPGADATSPADAGATCGPTAAVDPGAPTDVAARLAAVLARVAAAQTKFEAAKTRTVRSYTYFALYDAVLAPTRDDATAKADVTAAFTYQCQQGACSTPGLFLFHTSDTAYDNNSTAFTLEGLAAVLAARPDLYSASELAALAPKVSLALAELKSLAPLPSPSSTLTQTNVTTNIAVIEATDLVILGELFAARGPAGSASTFAGFATYGEQWMDAFLTRTASYGIDEFASASYTSAQLDALTLGARFAADPSRFQRALAYYWQDIGTNWFAGAGALGGAHSRNYDFLTGRGPIEQYAYLAGWVPSVPAATSAHPDEGFVFAALAASAGGFAPTDAARAHAFAGEKRLTARWNTSAGRDRTSYVTGTYALGTASVDFHASSNAYDQDATLVGALAGSGVANVTLAAEDDRMADNPYGDTKLLQGMFNKTYHLNASVVTVQADDVALATGFVAPDAAEEPYPHPTTLTMNVVLPVGAIDVDGVAVAGSAPVAIGGLILDRVGDAAVAVRLIAAVGCDGAPPAATVVFESAPKTTAINRARLRIAAYDGGTTPLTTCAAAPFAVAVAVGRCCDASCSNVRAKLGAGTVAVAAGRSTVEITAAGHVLHVDRASAPATAPEAAVRLIDGVAPPVTTQAGGLAIDGVAVAP